MLDEKTPMRHKLFLLSFLTTCSGFLAGVAATLIAIGLISEGSNYVTIVIGLVMLIVCILLGRLADTVHGQIRNYIMRPYTPGTGDLNDSKN